MGESSYHAASRRTLQGAHTPPYISQEEIKQGDRLSLDHWPPGIAASDLPLEDLDDSGHLGKHPVADRNVTTGTTRVSPLPLGATGSHGPGSRSLGKASPSTTDGVLRGRCSAGQPSEGELSGPCLTQRTRPQVPRYSSPKLTTLNCCHPISHNSLWAHFSPRSGICQQSLARTKRRSRTLTAHKVSRRSFTAQPHDCCSPQTQLTRKGNRCWNTWKLKPVKYHHAPANSSQSVVPFHALEIVVASFRLPILSIVPFLLSPYHQGRSYSKQQCNTTHPIAPERNDIYSLNWPTNLTNCSLLHTPPKLHNLDQPIFWFINNTRLVGSVTATNCQHGHLDITLSAPREPTLYLPHACLCLLPPLFGHCHLCFSEASFQYPASSTPTHYVHHAYYCRHLLCPVCFSPHSLGHCSTRRHRQSCCLRHGVRS